MHSQPRNKPYDPARKAEAVEIKGLQPQVLHNHHNNIYTKEALEISSKLLKLNPEFYTGWNYRKLAFEHTLRGETDQEYVKSIVTEELELVKTALIKNPKSYGAWHHRKWILNKGLLSSYDQEFLLLNELQEADERNFHAWNYRRFVAALKNVPKEEEIKFTTKMICHNFSNYSAWHNRSAILSKLLKQKGEGFSLKEKVLREEYEFVHGTLMEEDVQSGWFYHLWLLEETVAPYAPVLVSSWPVGGSDLTVSFENNMDGCLLPTFPLVLYFNQPVEGLSTSTVTIDVTFPMEDLTWRPLSSNNSKKAQTWVAFLKFPHTEDDSSKAYPVEVRIGHSQGIVSSSGSNYSFPSQFAFTVSLKHTKSKSAKGVVGSKMLDWSDGSLHTCHAYSDLSLMLSLGQPRIGKDPERITSAWLIETLNSEIAIFQDFFFCKIGKLAVARLLMAHDSVMTHSNSFEYKVNSEKLLQLFSDLMELDPTHSRYYKDEHSLVLMEKVMCDRKSSQNHCLNNGESSSSNLCNSTCMRLNNLSLSKIGALHHLLWVQILDLSHNELQSIEGLEAMQLLCCLNLSYNRFRSFTALEPLKLLQSLKVLDISYNEIGVHLVDTTRYLCSSPLSRTAADGCNFDDFATTLIKVAGSWEAVLFFKGLQLRQLDLVGNAVSDENFRSLLVKVLPKLKWLDGKGVSQCNYKSGMISY